MDPRHGRNTWPVGGMQRHWQGKNGCMGRVHRGVYRWRPIPHMRLPSDAFQPLNVTPALLCIHCSSHDQCALVHPAGDGLQPAARIPHGRERCRALGIQLLPGISRVLSRLLPRATVVYLIPCLGHVHVHLPMVRNVVVGSCVVIKDGLTLESVFVETL